MFWKKKPSLESLLKQFVETNYKLLETQVVLIGVETKTVGEFLPNIARDDWSVFYVSQFALLCAKQLEVPEEKHGFAVQLALADIFRPEGEDSWASYKVGLLNVESGINVELFEEAISAANNDFQILLGGHGALHAKSWATYVHDLVEG